MVLPFKPYVSRSQRILNWWKTRPREFFRDSPEEFLCWTLIFPAVIARFGYMFWKDGINPTARPYYRYKYEVRRPDDPLSLAWRTPEDYPAYYQSNRDNVDWSTYHRDYGFNSKTA
ncbi:hypothetical protein DdX_07583 [Ditylenchus destructor]|uniref:Uncharacterized protein n=1 Tax=Ditylenchus destructor TaxID=166010 RepID=A0AAD4R8H8_9BILA|nr:hypothetical protein DdX_07583 [Ditylenchus destructor]